MKDDQPRGGAAAKVVPGAGQQAERQARGGQVATRDLRAQRRDPGAGTADTVSALAAKVSACSRAAADAVDGKEKRGVGPGRRGPGDAAVEGAGPRPGRCTSVKAAARSGRLARAALVLTESGLPLVY